MLGHSPVLCWHPDHLTWILLVFLSCGWIMYLWHSCINCYQVLYSVIQHTDGEFRFMWEWAKLYLCVCIKRFYIYIYGVHTLLSNFLQDFVILFSDFMDKINYLSNMNYIRCLNKNAMTWMKLYWCGLCKFLRSDRLDIAANRERTRTVLTKYRFLKNVSFFLCLVIWGMLYNLPSKFSSRVVRSCPPGVLASETLQGCLWLSHSRLPMTVGQPTDPQLPGMEPIECTTAKSGFKTSSKNDTMWMEHIYR